MTHLHVRKDPCETSHLIIFHWREPVNLREWVTHEMIFVETIFQHIPFGTFWTEAGDWIIHIYCKPITPEYGKWWVNQYLSYINDTDREFWLHWHLCHSWYDPSAYASQNSWRASWRCKETDSIRAWPSYGQGAGAQGSHQQDCQGHQHPTPLQSWSNILPSLCRMWMPTQSRSWEFKVPPQSYPPQANKALLTGS